MLLIEKERKCQIDLQIDDLCIEGVLHHALRISTLQSHGYSIYSLRVIYYQNHTILFPSVAI